ncbi:MAG: flagellar basal body rod protein FlgB [Alphaproteobacteria bacterium]|nr:flagellar basal body rod protein FlgB [Alphaproteobacteria bacterium]MDD9919423.1 flagellar basal body rod protein FlgB [Alphaproteobacteria bacterium]
MPVTSASLSAALTHRMNHLIARQGVISGNIANANTPGYIAKDVTFKKLYDRNSIGMASSKGNHLRPTTDSASGKLITDKTRMALNGNSVQLDQEMVKLNDVQLHYRMATQLYSKYTAMQRTALGRAQ